jgi:acetolactate synthase-1/2/3 large subunit
VSEHSEPKLGRRNFLKGAALGGVAAAVTVPGVALAAEQAAEAGAAAKAPAGPAPRPTTADEHTDRSENLVYASCGGDYMVDVIRGLGMEYFAAVPGNTFMGLQEAVINYGMVTEPTLHPIVNMHEEASVAMAHGYAKIEGKPLACMVHTAVGLQHACMAIYNAWADRVPIFIMVGTSAMSSMRRTLTTDWQHSAADPVGLVRDMTKWSNAPSNLQEFGESAAHAYKISMTPPYGPVILAVDSSMQEDEIPGGQAKAPPIPKLPHMSPPAGEESAVRDTAKMLVEAANPVIYADRAARTPEGLKLLVELAETLQAPVCDGGNRLNFPWRHPLNQSRRTRQLLAQADVLLALEATDPFTLTTNRDRDGNIRPLMPANSKRITISSLDLFQGSNYGDYQRYPSYIDLAMAADAEATLPSLIEEVKRQLPDSRKAALEARGAKFAKAHQDTLNTSRQNATYGWDDSPVSMPRLYMELYEQIKNDDWSLVSGSVFQSLWPQQLWTADKHYQYIGEQGAAGIGYMAPATLGAALANNKHGRLSIAVVGDGDLMFGPGILWTAAHHKIPLLYIVHNNRGYHQEIMQLQLVAGRRQRGIDRVGIATDITNPNIDYAAMAKSLGVYGEGPIENPKDLGPAIKRALAVVRKGEPALIDVVSQPR